MFQEIKNSKYPAIVSHASKKNHLWIEVRRLLWLACAVALMLALFSYAPSDPSWSTWSSRTQFQNWMGRLGSVLADLLFQIFGVTSFVIPFLLLFSAVQEKPSERTENSHRLASALPLFFLASLSALVQNAIQRKWMPWPLQNTGGIVGYTLSSLLSYAAGDFGSLLISAVVCTACAILLFRYRILTALKDLTKALFQFLVGGFSRFGKIPLPLSTRQNSIDANTVGALISEAHEFSKPMTDVLDRESPWISLKRPKLLKAKTKPPRPKDFQLPTLSLLSGRADTKAKPIDKNWYLEKGNILVQKLKDFGVEGEVVNISPGPVITVYEFKPASGVKIKEISNLSDDLTLALSVLSVRIVAPIPGKPVVGIEIPSPHREMVFFKDLIQETPFFDGDIKIPILLGRLGSGEPIASDLASMPHLLIAGTTGTGKSVFINTLICSLLYRFTPRELKLILVDPKMVELSHYEGIPHLLLPVVVDSKKAALALRWTVEEMERRYTLMHQFGVRHLDAYNARVTELQKEENDAPDKPVFLPYIVVVIDEYADLMAVVPKDVELSIARLAQKARASGIHLVLATQRPSTDVVTGTIKANFPSRISFRVASSVDSKTILDRTGADRLLGNGDLLFHSAGFSTLKRMQGPYLSDADIQRVVDHLKDQGEPEYDERILQAQDEETKEISSRPEPTAEENQLYDAAVRLVTEKGEASISLIQRHLRIGYNRAASLMEQLENDGIVAQSNSPTKRRSVLVNT